MNVASVFRRCERREHADQRCPKCSIRPAQNYRGAGSSQASRIAHDRACPPAAQASRERLGDYQPGAGTFVALENCVNFVASCALTGLVAPARFLNVCRPGLSALTAG
jgi:hypothetical protein